MSVLGLAPSLWKTDTYRRLNTRLDSVLGDKTAKPFEKLKIRTVGDLVRHVPRRYFSGTELSDLSQLQSGEEAAVLAEVQRVSAHNLPEPGRFSAKKPRLEVTVSDKRGSLVCTFFGNPQLITFWSRQLSIGARGIFAGKVGEFGGRRQLANPDFVIINDDGQVIGGAKRNQALATTYGKSMIGLYPLTGRLRTWTVAESVSLALSYLAGVADPLPEWVRQQAGVLDLETALHAVHFPPDKPTAYRGRDRLRFDEAFSLQLTMAVRRSDAAANPAVPRPRRSGGLLDAFDARLPFTLTNGQLEIGDQIFSELAESHPMQRLLQGEVGSGKTLVALRAMLAVVDAGGQAALLAPTEVLASQHKQTIDRLLGDLGQGGTLSAHDHATRAVLLTGSLPAAQKRAATEAAASGDAGLIIGTHALLSAGVGFADLGLVVVDEQHRFGVEQRAALSAKAAARPHVLVMTATPIPRTVAMTVFGDLETSTLREIPAGRAEVSTVVVDAARQPGWVGRAWQRIVEEVASGRQAYVVCARITATEPAPGDDADEERTPAVAVEDLFAELAGGPLSGVRVEMLHGQLPADEKDAVMGRFNAGQTDVLIATTVVEVGVDVPNASVMVICDADRFGISQLHQLRGRIGRGGHPGVCLLLTTAAPETPARHRLAAVAATRDGFELAEIDLEQRREGDVLGASQSGLQSSLKLLRVLADAELIAQARELAEACIAADPELSDPGLADIVTDLESDAAGEWLERS